MKANKMTNAQAAVYYRELGFAIVPVKFDSTGTLIPPPAGHRKWRWSIDKVRQHWKGNPDDGIALILGVTDPGFNNIGAIDLDRHPKTNKDGSVAPGSDGFARFKELVPYYREWDNDTYRATTPRNGEHILVYSDSLSHSTGSTGIDLLGNGLLFVAPTYRNGKRYQWRQNGVLKASPPELLALTHSQKPSSPGDGNASPVTPRDIDLDALPITESLKEAIRNCSGAEVERFEGDRSAMVAHVAFRLCIEGVTREEALSILTQREYAISEKPLENRKGDRTSAVQWVDSYQWSQAVAKVGRKRWRRFRELEGKDIRPARVDFPMEALPPTVRNLVRQTADSLGLDPALPATQALTCISALVARRYEVRPGGLGKNWKVLPILWGLTIAPPGTGKTPALNLVMAPIHKVQDRYFHEFWISKDLYEQDKALERKRTKGRSREGTNQPEAEAPESERPPSRREPVCKRMVLGDATVEALQMRLVENSGRPMIVVRDEVVGLLTKLADERFAADRAFLLSCADGGTAEIVDRVSRGTVYLKEPALAIIGNATPNRILQELSGISRDDGLMQRFQLVCYADSGYRKRSWEPEDPSIATTWDELLVGLAVSADGATVMSPEEVFEVGGSSRSPLIFDAEAQTTFIEMDERLREELHSLRASDGLSGHLAKRPRFIASLAAILHVVESWPNVPPTITLATLRGALALAAYYRDQAERLYEAGASPTRLAKDVVEALPKLGSRFTAHYLGRKVAPLRDQEVAERVLSYLVDYGHLRDEGVIRTSATGRNPSRTYTVHPFLAEQLGLEPPNWAASDFADLAAPSGPRSGSEAAARPARPYAPKPEPAQVPITQGGPAGNVAEVFPGDPPAPDSDPSENPAA